MGLEIKIEERNIASFIASLNNGAITGRSGKEISPNVYEAIDTTKETIKQEEERLSLYDLAIQALEAYQPWIPVSERLPEVGVKVMLVNCYSPEEYSKITIGQLHQTDKRRKPYWKWIAYRGYEDYYSDWICPGEEFVTHWMPFPQPPKGEHNEH